MILVIVIFSADFLSVLTAEHDFFAGFHSAGSVFNCLDRIHINHYAPPEHKHFCTQLLLDFFELTACSDDLTTVHINQKIITLGFQFFNFLLVNPKSLLALPDRERCHHVLLSYALPKRLNNQLLFRRLKNVIHSSDAIGF